MLRQPIAKIIPVLFCTLFSLVVFGVASDNSLSLFQYATPLEVPLASLPQLAELRLSKPMYNALRNDFADLRVVQRSNNGVVPVRIVRLGPPDHALVSRSLSFLAEIPADLSYRYPRSGIVLVDTGRVPLTDVRVSLERSVSGDAYMFLGRGGAHAAGTEWRLLKHLRIEESLPRLDISFEESSFMQYALVADHGKRTQFRIDSVSGPDYYAYFEIQPGERYTLLCGYPDALPVSGFNTEAIDCRLDKGETPVQVTVSSLVENEMWSGTSLKGFALQCSFLIPLAVVAGLVFILLVFVVVYTLVNRKRPVKTGFLPRFYK